MTSELIRTDYEKLLEIGLKSLNVNYHTGEIYCFRCDKTFTWLRGEPPEQCGRGLHKWDGPGQFARPDFLIYGNDVNWEKDVDTKPLAVIRVDGPVHDKRKQKQKDKIQAQEFMDRGIKVFVVRNQWLLGAEHIITKKTRKWISIQFPDWIYTAIALVITLCINNDNTYKRYLKDKEVKHYLGNVSFVGSV